MIQLRKHIFHKDQELLLHRLLVSGKTANIDFASCRICIDHFRIQDQAFGGYKIFPDCFQHPDHAARNQPYILLRHLFVFIQLLDRLKGGDVIISQHLPVHSNQLSP